MKIEMKRINRHKLFPFMYKEVILEITDDRGKKYEQPICTRWILDIKKGVVKDVKVNY